MMFLKPKLRSSQEEGLVQYGSLILWIGFACCSFFCHSSSSRGFGCRVLLDCSREERWVATLGRLGQPGVRGAHIVQPFATAASLLPPASASPSTIKGLSAGWNTNINIIANQQPRACTTRRSAETNKREAALL